MLIVNGTITAKTWAQPIPCNVKANRGNYLGKQNGNTFTVASYEVLIESQPFEAGRVRLTENGCDLGEFSVLWTERLDAVGAVKIVV
jgi:hypothetical protein